jgi:4-hydroxybenzoate polyprenyltransferase
VVGCLLALSRAQHAVLDIATPAAAALLWLGRFPSLSTIAVGLVAAFAGYMSVYALNDVVDCREDQKRLKLGCRDYGDYLDARMLRHPVAECAVSMRAAVAWVGALGAVALVAAVALNPVCAGIFAGAFALEAGYCLLCRVTPLRTLLSGLVKSAGALAAVFAVDAAPNPGRFLLLFGWLFLWEIGGQNIPADWSDVDEDRTLGHRTLPVVLQATWASRLSLATLCGSVLLSLLLAPYASAAVAGVYLAGALGGGILLLLVPAVKLLRGRAQSAARGVFNRASYYPLWMLGLALVSMGTRSLTLVSVGP